MSSGCSPHPPTGGKERAGPCHPLGGGGGGGLGEERDDSSDYTEVRRREREYFMSTS